MQEAEARQDEKERRRRRGKKTRSSVSQAFVSIKLTALNVDPKSRCVEA